MPWRAVWLGALLCAFAVSACGERAGDPVVRLDSAADAGAGDTGGGRPSPSGGQGGGEATPAAPATASLTGLCGACASSDECGDANDACLWQDGENFCGRDCDEGFGCPDGYTCTELANSPLEQCVPNEGCRAPPPIPPSLAEIREYLLARVNAERLDRGRSPLEPMTCLDGLAQDSALAYAQTGERFGKFVKECDPIWPNCNCGWSAEAEIAVARIGLDWLDAIDLALGSARDGDERFIESFLDLDVTHVGIGFYLSADEAWIALSFS
jgi:hypothetical protein